MDKICKEAEGENLNNSFKESGEGENANCGSPVFRCVTQTKPVRKSFLDSSDYDIPSYQVNQSLRSRASSKYESETGDPILPFSPIFSPIPVATIPQFQPPSIHTLNTVCKNTEKTIPNRVNNSSVNNRKDVFKSGGIFDSLGMLDKDVSWVSSMASPTPKLIPGSEFNTVEKATFLPEGNFQSIQPRALFSPTFDDDFGCQPISFTSESDDDEAYKSNIRLSDVCTTLKQLEVKSVDQVSNNSVEKTITEEEHVISPVIKTKKRTDSLKNKKKGALVLSPERDKYEFSVGESLKVIEPDDTKSNDVSSFSEEDLFQSISFSGIDELCKTLVSDKSDSTLMFMECDKTLVDSITTKPRKIFKKFYSTKAPTTIHSVTSVRNLHTHAKPFLQNYNCLSTHKIKQSLTDQGIVRFDALSKESCTKRLHSDVSNEKDESVMKKFKKVDNSAWENFEDYLSESQLNVIDHKIMETVEKLEKTLASQEQKGVKKLSGGSAQDEETQSSSNSPKGSEKSQELKQNDKSETSKIETEKNLLEMQLPAFKTASGLNISVSKKALSKAGDLLRDCDENLESFVSEECENKQLPTIQRSFVGFRTCSGKEIKITDEALAKGKSFMMECEASFKQNCDETPKKFWNDFENLLCVSGRPNEDLEKPNLHGNENFKKEAEGDSQNSKFVDHALLEDSNRQEEFLQMKGFTTNTGKLIKVSAGSLEKAKTLMLECDNEYLNNTAKCQTSSKVASNEKSQVKTIFKGFSTGSGKSIQISATAMEKAKIFMKECEEDFKDSCKKSSRNKDEPEREDQTKDFDIPMVGFSTALGKKVEVSEKALERGKMLMKECEKEFHESCKKSSRNKDEPERQSQTHSFDIPMVGFSTALGKKVKISEKALEKGKMLMKECEKDFNEIYKSATSEVEPKNKLIKESDAPGISSCTALGKKVKIFSKALEKAKSPRTKPVQSEMNTPETSSKLLPAPSAAGQRKEEPESSKSDSANDQKLIPTLGIGELDDWDEIIPSWLHVYTTSPSMTSEGLEISPVTTQEKSSMPYSENVVENPMLGPSDRFYRKPRTLKLEKSESSNSLRRVSAKRTLNMDFSVPFKKIKVEDLKTVSVNVKEERVRARKEQEKIAEEKQKVRPVEGSHLRRKRTEKQISWMEAVGKSNPEAYSDDCLKSLGVREDVLLVNVENSMKFRFDGEQYYGLSDCMKNTTGFPTPDGSFLILDDDNKLGVKEIKRAFLATPGVQPNLLPSGWVENHYKWIIWKLAHYERSFPAYFKGKCLTPNQVILQLKYRYDREIDRNERSALKKILEKDDSSLKRLVLCVCGVKKVIENDITGYELEVTDGWYSCPARGDQALFRLIDEGKLCVGVKILTQGAVLVGCEQGVSPLEMSEGVYLRISTNSTRRARWDTKLGFQKNPENFPISLSSILPQGGSISRIDVIVVRIYPMLYMEKIDGHHVTRNRRAEEKADAEYRRLQEQRIEAIYNEVQAEMRKSGKEKSKGSSDLCQSGEDPLALENSMSAEERKVFSNENEFSRELRQKIEKKLEEEKLKQRIVSQVLRVKIVDFRKPDYNNPALLSVWNPNEDWSSALIEGKVVSVMNVTISNSLRMYKPLQINTTRQTHFRPIMKNVKYPARNLTLLKNVSSKVCPAFEEVDVVGVVILIQDVSYGSRLSQVVYLTDLEMNFVGIVFWGSCKDFGWENVLRVKSIVACSNLQWKKNYSPQDVPSVYVNESSIFTENPKQSYLKKEIERLKQNLPQDIPGFLSKCEEDLTTKLEDSKWRTNTSKNSSNDSSLRENSKISGFESKPTASSTPIKPFTFKSNTDNAEPSPIQKRIEKLQCYGEPSPLIPLLIRNNMKRKFKK